MFLVAGEGHGVYQHNPLIDPDRQSVALQYADGLSRNLRSLATGELPPQGTQAFCIDGAYLKGNEFRSESMNITVRFPGHPGVVFTLFSSTKGEDGPTMLERMHGDGVGKLLGLFAGMKVLRKGQRDVNGLDAEEHLIAATEKGNRNYVFNWEAQGRAESVASPVLAADLAVVIEHTDSPPTPAFTSDAQALQLWDALIGSIRPLPGSRDAPPPAPRDLPLALESFEQREHNQRLLDHFIATGEWLPSPKAEG